MAYYKNPKFVHAANCGGALLGKFKEASGQSFKAGQPVYLNASGAALTACASNATSILGFVNQDASGTAGTVLSVTVLRAGDVVEFDIYQGSTVDAATDAMRLQNFAIDVTANECTLDLNDTSNDSFTLLDIIDADAVKVHAKPLASVLQYEVGF